MTSNLWEFNTNGDGNKDKRSLHKISSCIRLVNLGSPANNSLNDLRYTPFDLNVPERSFRPRNSRRFFESMFLKVNGITATSAEPKDAKVI